MHGSLLSTAPQRIRHIQTRCTRRQQLSTLWHSPSPCIHRCTLCRSQQTSPFPVSHSLRSSRSQCLCSGAHTRLRQLMCKMSALQMCTLRQNKHRSLSQHSSPSQLYQLHSQYTTSSPVVRTDRWSSSHNPRVRVYQPRISAPQRSLPSTRCWYCPPLRTCPQGNRCILLPQQDQSPPRTSPHRTQCNSTPKQIQQQQSTSPHCNQCS